jgi:hypothetical protein
MILTLFSLQDPSLPSIKLSVIEGRNQLWGKTREAFRHIWNHYRDQADWFFKADDDTYEIRPFCPPQKNFLSILFSENLTVQQVCHHGKHALFFVVLQHFGAFVVWS